MQYFSDSLAKHTTKGMKERVMNGLPNGDIPFGYRRHDKDNPTEKEGHIYIVPDEAEVVKKIFQLYSSGEWTLSELAAWRRFWQLLIAKTKREVGQVK